MYWITFFVSGLIVSSIPWVAGHFNNRIAGYILLVPVIFTLGLINQYISHGRLASADMIKSTIIALPALLIFALAAYILLKNNINLVLTLALSLLAWFVTIFLINLIST